MSSSISSSGTSYGASRRNSPEESEVGNSDSDDSKGKGVPKRKPASLLPLEGSHGGALLPAETVDRLQRLKGELAAPKPSPSRDDMEFGAFVGGGGQWLVSFGIGSIVGKILGADGTLAYMFLAGMLQPPLGETFQKIMRDQYGTYSGHDLSFSINWGVKTTRLFAALCSGDSTQIKKAYQAIQDEVDALIVRRFPEIKKEKDRLEARLAEDILHELQHSPPDDLEKNLRKLNDEMAGALGELLDDERKNEKKHIAHAIARTIRTEVFPLVAWVAPFIVSGALAPTLAVALKMADPKLTLALDIIFTLGAGFFSSGHGSILNNRWRQDVAVTEQPVAGLAHPDFARWAKDLDPQTVTDSRDLHRQLDEIVKGLDAQAQPHTKKALEKLQATFKSMIDRAEQNIAYHATGPRQRTWAGYKGAVNDLFSKPGSPELVFHKMAGNLSVLALYSQFPMRHLAGMMNQLKASPVFLTPHFFGTAGLSSSMGGLFALSYFARPLTIGTSLVFLGGLARTVRNAIQHCRKDVDESGPDDSQRPAAKPLETGSSEDAPSVQDPEANTDPTTWGVLERPADTVVRLEGVSIQSLPDT